MPLKSSKRIQIKNVPIGTDADIIDLIFSSPKYGSHEIVNVKETIENETTKTFMVEFKDEISQEDIEKFNKIEIGNFKMQTMLAFDAQVASYDDTRDEFQNDLSSNMIKVRAKHDKVNAEYVDLYLSNEKYGGGEIVEIKEVHERKGTYLVKFKTNQIAKRVLSRKHAKIIVESFNGSFEDVNSVIVNEKNNDFESNKSLKEEIETKIDDQVTNIESYKCKLLLKACFISQIKSQLSDLTIKIIPTQNLIKFNGFRASIDMAKLKMNEILSKIKVKELVLTPDMFTFYQSCSSYIDKIFADENICSSYELKRDKIVIRALDDIDISNIICKLDSEISEFKHVLKDESLNLLDDDFSQFVTHLKQDLVQTNEEDHVIFLISKQNKTITLIGNKILVDKVLKHRIKDFFENNTFMSAVLTNLTQHESRFLKLVKSYELQNVCLELSKRYNEAKCIFEGDDGALQVRIAGNQRAYYRIVQIIRKMFESQIKYKLVINELGFNALFEGDKGKRTIEAIEKQSECLLNVEKGQKQSELSVENDQTNAIKTGKTIYSSRTSYGNEIFVIETKIEQFKGAKLIFQIEDMMKNFNDGEFITKILKKADKEGLDSIAFPLIAPEKSEYIVPLMIDSVLNYLSMKSPLKRIYFVDSEHAYAFKNYLKCFLGPSIDQADHTRTITKANNCHLVIGSLLDDTKSYDGLVITTSADLDLTNGTLAKLILQKAGISVQAELNQKYPHGLNDRNPVAVTSGGLLKGVKHLFCICLLSWGSDEEDVLQNSFHETLKKVLQEAHSKGCKNIAIPALGTGLLNYPKNKVAKWMFDIINKSQLNQVNIILYEKDIDTISAFRAVETQTPTKSDKSFCKIKVDVVLDDIILTKLDVLVNPTDIYLNLDGGVSSALRRQIGRAFDIELASKKIQNGIVWTKAFNLKAKEILHVDVRSESLKNTLTRIFNEVDAKKYSSIALPVIGTGNQQMTNHKDLMKFFKEAILSFSKQSKHVDLIQIYVCHQQKALHDDFKLELSSVTQESIKSSINNHLEFTLVSDTREKINRAEVQIRAIIQENTKTLEIKNDYIEKIDAKNLNDLELILKSNYCRYKIEQKKNLITLTGSSTSTDECYRLVNDRINQLLLNENKQTKAKLIAKDVQWELECNTTKKWKKFNIYMNEKIEEAFQAKKHTIEVESENNDKCLIDFASSLISPVDGLTPALAIRRSERSDKNISIALPLTWEQDKNFDLIKLDAKTTEYKSVEDIFVSRGMKLFCKKIMSIERIQNERLFIQYEAHKKFFNDRNPNTVNEKQLFHGTFSDSIKSIWSYGFNRSYAGKNATAYGKGVYFARDSNYSHNYTNVATRTPSVPSVNLIKCEMFISKVLVGNSAQGSPTICSKSLPKLPDGSSVDSTVDIVANPTIFVIYHDAQAYPEYLITYYA